MKTVVLMVFLLGLATAAEAAKIASPTIFGAHTQNVATCTALNAGTSTITLTVKIVTESGATVDTRTVTLVPGDFTALSENISIGVPYACVVSSDLSLAFVRAALIIEEPVDHNGTTVQRPMRSAPLR